MARTKKLKLLVDNLQHISDHGLKVEFEKPELKAWVESMWLDGQYKFTVGESWLQVQTLGNVTFTEFCRSGNSPVVHAHYLDRTHGLSMTATAGEEVQVLRHVILKSDKAPDKYGGMYNLGGSKWSSRIDEAKNWLKDSGWCLFGQHGMRAKAQAGKLALQRTCVDKTRQGIAELQTQAKELDTSTDRWWKDKQKSARSKYDVLSNTAETYHIFLRLYPTPETMPEDLGIFSDSIYRGHNELYTMLYTKRGKFASVVIQGHGQQFTPELVRPNYKVEREDGSIKLSSGLVCDLQEEDVLAWLRGEREAPASRYGLCSKVLTRTDPPYPRPYVLLQCGCHVVDVVRDLGEPYASLLAPAHEVQMREAVPDLLWTPEDRPKIWQHLAAICHQKLTGIQAEKRVLLAGLREARAALPNRAQECAVQREQLLNNEIDLLKKLEQQEQVLKEMEVVDTGATLKQLLQMAAHVVNTLLPATMEVPK